MTHHEHDWLHAPSSAVLMEAVWEQRCCGHCGVVHIRRSGGGGAWQERTDALAARADQLAKLERNAAQDRAYDQLHYRDIYLRPECPLINDRDREDASFDALAAREVGQ